MGWLFAALGDRPFHAKRDLGFSMSKERSPATREKVVKSDRPFYAKKRSRPFHTKKRSRPFHTKKRSRPFHEKKAIRLTPRFANELYITKKRSPFPFKREFDLLALNQWVSRSPILLNHHRSPFSSLTKIPIAANLKDAIID
jgi:hypothetical protein